MAWVESASESFLCRHSSGDAEAAVRVLALLERTRVHLAARFPRTVDGLEVVLHDRDSSLLASNPLLALRRRITEPAARPYLAGWVGRHELHVLATSGIELAPASLYTQRVIVECNPDLERVPRLTRGLAALRCAWLIEGTARWCSGETARARAVIARRLREGPRPTFPPALRDVPLLAGTVIDLVAREEGEAAVVQLACRLHPGGPQAALSGAFGGRALVHTEGAWRSHLARLAASV